MRGESIHNPKEILAFIEADKEQQTEESLIDLIRICGEFYLWDYVEGLKKQAKKRNLKKAYQEAKSVLKKREAIPDTSVSACIMGRDRAEGLERCLKSIQGKVDEIVYVDTGSKDNSVEIAEKYGARVEYFEWCDDFSAVRNYSISFATKEWVYIIDTDEELIGDIKASILKCYKAGCDAISLKINDIRDGEKKGEMVSQVRIMRRAYMSFELPVHNQILGWASRYYDPELEFNHYGYEMTNEQRRKRNEQTLKIALEYVKDHKSAFMYYNIGVACMMKYNYGDAIEWLEKAIEHKRDLSGDYLAQSYVYLVKIYSVLRDTEKMLQTAQVAAQIRPNTELFYDLAAYFYQLHIYDKALEFFGEYMKAYEEHRPSEMYSTALDKKPAVERAMKYIREVLEWESTRAEGRQSSSQ